MAAPPESRTTPASGATAKVAPRKRSFLRYLRELLDSLSA